MATKGASSTSRRSISGVRQKNSASSSVPFAVHVGDRNDAVAPRIFLSCPFYKEKEPHCKFFVWVDEHLAKIGSNCCICDSRDLGEKHVEIVEEEEELDHRMTVLEEKIVALEKKKNPLAWCITVDSTDFEVGVDWGIVELVA
ncbi:hypothetical protein Ahy_A09g046133 [Arachis hypogaea]|uniref:Zinc finger GRF-type domain-containing protein n=1 Tax=Arachis hypogaea TaxID=3818 RepID=A0A445BNY1_ARAHY|nr:hypothetical protein Ahy_A09g046133 [Arachis hypogaea]